jgi:hypothetical protein
MGIRFACPQCEKRLNVKAFLAGKRGICPHCEARFRIPMESGSVPAASGDRPRATSSGSLAETAEFVRPSTSATATSTAQPGVASGAKMQREPVASDEPEVEISTIAEPTAGDTSSAEDPIAAAPEAVWYVRPTSGGQYGPAKGTIMQQWVEEGRVAPDSLVWREGWAEWAVAGQVLPCLMPEPTPKPATSDYLSFERGEYRGEHIVRHRERSSRNTTLSIALVAILGLLIVLLIVVLVLVLQK